VSDIAVRADHIYKRFRKGEIYNSLRDLIPTLTGRLFRQQELSRKDDRDFWALQDLSFEVKRGEAFGIVGENGAGKSTALKILSRIMRPSKGEMVVNGRLSALIEVTAGFHPDLTGRENIFLHGAILGMSRREIQSKLEQIIDFSGIEEFIDTPVKRYSTGMFARLGFSVAAHVDPEVLIVDEVLSVGDYLFQAKCVERMREVIRKGSTVLFVSHNLKNISEFCDRCLMLEKGRTVAIGPAQEVVSTYLQRPRKYLTKDGAASEVAISKARIRGEDGQSGRFKSGDTVWLDLEVTARVPCTKLTLSPWMTNEANEMVFETTTERLGLGNFSLEAGEVYSCTIEMRLNVTNGIYHLSALIYRHDTRTVYDEWTGVATIYVSSDDDVRGTAHCFPKVIHEAIRPASGASCIVTGEDSADHVTELPGTRGSL
jgi:ABC-type polysaccharide/polyol phosphate transport system ATPase subunit